MKVTTKKPITLYERIIMPPGEYELVCGDTGRVIVEFGKMMVMLKPGEYEKPLFVEIHHDIHPYFVPPDMPLPLLKGMVFPIESITVAGGFRLAPHEFTLKEDLDGQTVEEINRELVTEADEEALRKRKADCEGPWGAGPSPESATWLRAIWE